MIVETRHDYTLYICGPFVAVVWRGELSAEAFDHVERVLFRTADECGEPISFMTVASFQAPVPAPEIRTRIVDCYRRLGPRLRAVAQVVEGDGFWACAARCVIASIGLLHRGEHRMSVFGTVGASCEWLGAQAPVRDDVDTLARSLGSEYRSMAHGTT